MRRGVLAAGVFVGMALLAGCVRPFGERVYIDLERAWQARRIRPEQMAASLENFRPPAPPDPPADLRSEWALGPISSSEDTLRELERRREIALEKTRELREQAEAELREDALRRVLREAERKRAELAEEAEQDLLAVYDRLQARMTNLAVEYADLKSRLLIRRAVLSARGGAAPEHPNRQEVLADTEKRLSELDLEQAAMAEALERDAAKQAGDLFGNVQVRLNEYMQNQIVLRLREIERQLAAEEFDLRLVLPDQPLTPALSTLPEVLALEPLPPAPKPLLGAYRKSAEWERREREELRKEAALWAKAKGYRLAASPIGARDVTDRFIEEVLP